MKVIQHSVFAESRERYSILSLLFSAGSAQRARNRQRIREQAATFINAIGLESVVSITENASTLEPFSVAVWWYREMPDTETETLVIRASDASETP